MDSARPGSASELGTGPRRKGLGERNWFGGGSVVRRATVGRKQPGARSFSLGLIGQPNGGDPLKQRSSNPCFLKESSGAGVRTDV